PVEEIVSAVESAVRGDQEGSEVWEQEAVPDPAAGAGRMIAVWGPTGAPGRSTVAVNLAAEAAASGRETVLVDADAYGPAERRILGVLDEAPGLVAAARAHDRDSLEDRKSTRLNSSHVSISYAVFCL